MTNFNFAHRRQQVLGSLDEAKLDLLIVSSPANIRYLSGFTGSNGLLLLARGQPVLFTDPRYEIQAASESDCRVVIARRVLAEEAMKTVRRKRWKRIGFDPVAVTFETYQKLHDLMPPDGTLVAAAGAVERYRMVKSEEEIELIRRSVHVNSQSFERTLRRFKPGVRESELAAELEYQMRRLGAEKPSFETIVAAGSRTALPHAQPTLGRIESGEPVLVDMGACLEGYASDMTRMFFPGGPSRRMKEIYGAVLEAQLAAIDAVKEGVTAEKVDRAARNVLKAKGLDKAFIHSTGHGLGLEIHERPRIGKRDRTRLQTGMAITIEPGAYIEDFGGVRIEDTVVVTAAGCDVLTPTSKELLVL